VLNGACPALFQQATPTRTADLASPGFVFLYWPARRSVKIFPETFSTCSNQNAAKAVAKRNSVTRVCLCLLWMFVHYLAIAAVVVATPTTAGSTATII